MQSARSSIAKLTSYKTGISSYVFGDHILHLIYLHLIFCNVSKREVWNFIIPSLAEDLAVSITKSAQFALTANAEETYLIYIMGTR